jgi:hypothetical protein
MKERPRHTPFPQRHGFIIIITIPGVAPKATAKEENNKRRQKRNQEHTH